MYLTSTADGAKRTLDSGAASPAGEEVTVHDLLAQMTAAFPDVSFSSAVIEERGGDHRMLILDSKFVFRFPRRATRRLDVEVAILEALRGRTNVSVPECSHVDPAGRFAGYALIHGAELTPIRFHSLSAGSQDRVLEELGRFLAILHGLAPTDILPHSRWPAMPTKAQRAAGLRDRHLPAIAQAFEELATRIDQFQYDHTPEHFDPEVVLHGDLVEDHILLRSDGDGLAGIIDFGDVALGDPAQDLMGLWAYGRRAVETVIASYKAGSDDGLLERSRRAYASYRIGRLADTLASGGGSAAKPLVPELVALLDATEASRRSRLGRPPAHMSDSRRRR